VAFHAIPLADAQAVGKTILVRGVDKRRFRIVHGRRRRWWWSDVECRLPGATGKQSDG
jgi:hypothetical protein